jgi:hypothetical protein
MMLDDHSPDAESGENKAVGAMQARTYCSLPEAREAWGQHFLSRKADDSHSTWVECLALDEKTAALDSMSQVKFEQF